MSMALAGFLQLAVVAPPAGGLLLAIIAPVLAGLATLLLPRAAVTARVVLAGAGPALAFVLVLWHLGAHGVAGHTPPPESHHASITHVADTSGTDDLASQVIESSLSHASDAGRLAAPPQGTAVIEWVPDLDLNLAFLADGLGGFFALLVAGIGVLIVLYARGYFGGATEQARADLFRFYPTLGFFASAMLGVVLADYTLLTLVFWELTSISSFLLIGWNRYDKAALKLAKQAFFTTGLGGMFLLGGIGLLGYHTGHWRWSELLQHANDLDWSGGTLKAAFLLMFVGAASKSAQWPLHYWLPGAMAAPTPVSAYLHSATMVKAGVFLVGRMLPLFVLPGEGVGVDIWPGLITWIGAITMLYGGVTAVNQHDLKRIFAYTTVSQLGLLMAMYGLAGFDFDHAGHVVAAAIDLDITQIANHAFYKAPLFITAGAIGHYLSRSLPDLHGAFYKFPAICATMLLAGYALAAGPGTVSFQAKELFLYAIYHAANGRPWLWVILAMTIATAACNVAIFVRLLTTLLGLPGSMGKADHDSAHDDDHGHGEDGHDHHHAPEPGLGGALIWLPAVPLVALQYIGGLAPGVWDRLFGRFERFGYYFDHGVPSLLYAITHPGVPLYASGVAIVLGVVLGLSKLLRGQHIDPHDAIYPGVEAASVGLGRGLFAVLQNGSLRVYLTVVLIALMTCLSAAAWHDPGMIAPIGAEAARAFELPLGVIVGLLIVITALLLPVFSSRIVRVLMLGSCGFTVVAMYVVYQAPDLALTQLMVEIIGVLLFVLVLRLLPEPPQGERALPVGKLWRAGLGLVVGLAFGWITLVCAHAQPEALLGEWFSQYSYHGPAMIDAAGEKTGYERGGGGKNVVNVILVDFRGFDTLGEISVLGLAALGVWSMLPGRRRELCGEPPAQANASSSDPSTAEATLS